MVRECRNSTKMKVFAVFLKNPKTQYQYQHKLPYNLIHILAHLPFMSAARTKETPDSTNWTYIALISQQYWSQTRSSIDSIFDMYLYSDIYERFLLKLLIWKYIIINQMKMNLYHLILPFPHHVATEMMKADPTSELVDSFEKL